MPQEYPAQNYGRTKGDQTKKQQVREAWEKVTERTCDPRPLSNLMQVNFSPNPTPFSPQPNPLLSPTSPRMFASSPLLSLLRRLLPRQTSPPSSAFYPQPGLSHAHAISLCMLST
jgi:hypothetical protein